MYSSQEIDQIEFIFQYGDVHWSYPPLNMSIRKIKRMMEVHSEIMEKQKEEMERIKKQGQR